ncbi:MAG: HAD-IA family hydrolase [Gammaproteobacteria bacterium]|nr:HAD-IA family hydrolase [Gammaproteobacteria bacterium]
MRDCRLIVFDWDGTLMDSVAQIVDAMHASMRDLNLEVLAEDQVKNIIGLGLREAIDALYPGRDDVFLQRFIERYRHYWFALSAQSELFPGAKQTLKLLQEQGLMLAIATGKGRQGLDKVLADTGLADYFQVTRCADETTSKPHPHMLHEIMSELDVKPEQTIMIGDTIYDMEMARNANVEPIAATYGVHEWERLLQFNPLFRLDELIELGDWVAEYCVDRANQSLSIAG